MPDYVSRKKVSIVPFKDGNRAWQGKQNQEKKKRSCTRGLLVAACQHYLLRLAHVSNLFSSFLVWGSFSSEDSPRACASVSFVWCISTGWRQSSPRTRSHGANYKYRGRHSAADHCDLFSCLPPLSLPRISVSQIGGPRFRVYTVSLGCWYKLPSLVEGRELLLSLWTVFRGVKLGSQRKRLVKFEILRNVAIKPRSD